MISRTPRTLVAVLTTLGLVAALTAVPVAAQEEEPVCELTAEGSLTEEVTDGVTLTFGSDFACTDAADAGTWSITVDVTNDSDTDVTVDSLSLSHASPPFGDEDANTADATGLPLAVAAGASGSFDASGSYALVETGDGDLVNLHLRAAGSTADDESAPFVLGINVHVLGPGTELGDDAENSDQAAEGRPSWVPGPPPWVVEMLRSIFPLGFPWGTDTFPPDDDGEEEEAAVEEEAEADVDVGPPAGLELPPPATGGGDGDESETETDDGPPDWVNPGGPPEWVPAPPPGGRP
ncbi:MAG: hypothetical protein ACRDG7_10635 [Candidatus Limnocylindria bacterium]